MMEGRDQVLGSTHPGLLRKRQLVGLLLMLPLSDIHNDGLQVT